MNHLLEQDQGAGINWGREEQDSTSRCGAGAGRRREARVGDRRRGSAAGRPREARVSGGSAMGRACRPADSTLRHSGSNQDKVLSTNFSSSGGGSRSGRAFTSAVRERRPQLTEKVGLEQADEVGGDGRGGRRRRRRWMAAAARSAAPLEVGRGESG